MSDFRKITDEFYASPQIDAGQVAEAKALGVMLKQAEEMGASMGRALRTRLAGLHRQTPFFDANGKTVATVARPDPDALASAYKA